MQGLIHNMESGTLPAFTLENKHYVIVANTEDTGWLSFSWVRGKATTYRTDKVIGPVALGVWDDLS